MGRRLLSSSPPPSPTRSGDPFEGAEVAPVVSTLGASNESTRRAARRSRPGPTARATITFNTPGWHRIKATVTAAGKETAIRSNRLDVCVPDPPATDCGPLPADDLVRTPPADGGTGARELRQICRAARHRAGSGPPAPADSGQGRAARARQEPPRRRHRRRQLGSADAGSGSRNGRSPEDARPKGAHFVTRASGKAKSSTQVRCPAAPATRCGSPSSTCSGAARASSSGRSGSRARRALPRRDPCPRRARARRLGGGGAQPREPGLARQDRPLPAGSAAAERRIRRRRGTEPDHQRLDRASRWPPPGSTPRTSAGPEASTPSPTSPPTTDRGSRKPSALRSPARRSSSGN